MQHPLPEWDDLGEYFSEGLRLFCVALIYTLPIICLVFVFIVPSIIAQNADSEVLRNIGGGMAACVWCLIFPLGLAMAIWLPAALLFTTVEQRFGAAFEFGQIAAFIKAQRRQLPAGVRGLAGRADGRSVRLHPAVRRRLLHQFLVAGRGHLCVRADLAARAHIPVEARHENRRRRHGRNRERDSRGVGDVRAGDREWRIDAVAAAVPRLLSRHPGALSVLWNVPMPICARCTAIYVGLIVSFAVFLILPRMTERVARIVLCAAAIPMAIDGLTQLAGLARQHEYASHRNRSRRSASRSASGR